MDEQSNNSAFEAVEIPDDYLITFNAKGICRSTASGFDATRYAQGRHLGVSPVRQHLSLARRGKICRDGGGYQTEMPD